MAEAMYFQWQNPFLLRTIYPRRNRKLADFLFYCREIDLWKEYGKRDIGDLQPEVDQYVAERDRAAIEAYKLYKTEYAYFTNETIATHYADYAREGAADLELIRQMHVAFKKYLPGYRSVRKEINLVAWYASTWQQKIHRLQEEQVRLKRRLERLPEADRSRPALRDQLHKLENVTLAIHSKEYKRLVDFLTSYNQIEKRKQEFVRARDAAENESKRLGTELDALYPSLARQEAQCRQMTTDLARLRTPPKPEAFKDYFSSEDAIEALRGDFPRADPALIELVSGIHKRLVGELRALNGPDVRRSRIGDYLHELRGHYNGLLKEVNRLESQLRSAAGAPEGEKQGRLVASRREGLRAVEIELDRLSDYHVSLTYDGKPEAERAPTIRKMESDLQTVQKRLSDLQARISLLEQARQAQAAIHQKDEEAYLASFEASEESITVRDIVRARAAKYREQLEQRINPKDLPDDPLEQDERIARIQQELLEEIVQRFIQQPREFPLWLQYMVIHFSGMRYKTAHGSWADPKDLLKTLRTSELDRWFRGWNADAVEQLVEERLSTYQSPDPARAPRLALTRDPAWREIIDTHLQELRLPHKRRAALQELILAEESYEIDALGPEEALEQLRLLREGRDGKPGLPDWMWKEIVRLTDLRVREAKDEKWNELSQAEKDQKNEARYAELREVMNKWKEKYLIGWRQEHDRSNRLIVTSSVCNEVAEQILHLRGHSPGGGLTNLVDWFAGLMGKGQSGEGGQPSFVFAQKGAEGSYREGATLLWLRFVQEQPNEWRKAKPMVIDGVRLVPDKYRSKEGKEGEWSYFEDGFARRRRTRPTDKRKEEQWLRWIHAATVARVAETADGTVVLTFETALPYDDPSVSAVGVFQHYLPRLMGDGGEDNYNGSYIAYVPEGEIPLKDLEEMLDWNKILRREVMTAPQLEAYRRKHIRAS